MQRSDPPNRSSEKKPFKDSLRANPLRRRKSRLSKFLFYIRGDKASTLSPAPPIITKFPCHCRSQTKLPCPKTEIDSLVGRQTYGWIFDGLPLNYKLWDIVEPLCRVLHSHLDCEFSMQRDWNTCYILSV